MDKNHVKVFQGSLARLELLDALQSHRGLTPTEKVERDLLVHLAPAMRDALLDSQWPVAMSVISPCRP